MLNWKVNLMAVIVISLSALLVYYSSLSNEFVEIDDYHFILENEAIHQLSVNSVEYLFTEDTREYNYVPISFLFLAIEYNFFGHNPQGYHVISLFLHILNALLVFVLINLLTREIFLSYFTALLFALHPIQVETVSWIFTSSRTALSACFYLLSLVIYCYGKYSSKKGFKNYVNIYSVLTLVLFILATLAKTTAVILPVMFLSIDYFMASKEERSTLAFVKKNLSEKIIYIPIIFLITYLNSVAVENAPIILEKRYDILDHIAITGHAIAFYIIKTFVPTGLSVYYTPPPSTGGVFPFAYYAYSIFGYLSIITLTFFSFKNKYVFLGSTFFFFPIVLMLDTTLHTNDVIILLADRYHYVSLIGLLIVIGFGINKVSSYFIKSTKLLPWIILVILSLVFGYMSNHQTHVWENTISLYENTVSHQPCSEFYFRLGTAYGEAGNHEKVYQNYKEGFERMNDNNIFKSNYTAKLTPEDVGYMYYYKEGLIKWSIKFYELGTLLNPGDRNNWLILNRYYKEIGDNVKAEYCYSKAQELEIYK